MLQFPPVSIIPPMLHTLIHLPPTLYNVFLPVLQFPPASIIPQLLHTHPSTYHQRCIMFLSQYFSFPCQYHSTIAPYSSIHLPPTLYNVSLPVLQFSPVSIIPPLLHTHPSICHPHCIMFFSQYFSFPLSVPFHQCSILSSIYHPRCTMFFSPSTSVFPCQYHSTIASCSSIHLPPTLYNVFLPVIQFPPESIIPPTSHTHLHLNITLMRRTSGRNLGNHETR